VISAASFRRRPGRFDGIMRPYSVADVERLRGSVAVEHTLAQARGERLWELPQTEPLHQTRSAR
jgi:isocitrate lyase